MTSEQPATGILKQNDFGDAMFYYVQCECQNDECSHTIEVEADSTGVTVHLYHTLKSKWWEKSRWRQILEILIHGYSKTESTLVMSEQTALNYAEALKAAMHSVKANLFHRE